MSRTLEQIKILVAKGEVRISDHGYDELAADDILARDVVAGLATAELVEDYPDFPKGPCVLVLAPGPEWPTDSRRVGHTEGREHARSPCDGLPACRRSLDR